MSRFVLEEQKITNCVSGDRHTTVTPAPRSFPLSFVCDKEAPSEPNKCASEDLKLAIPVNTLSLDKEELCQKTLSLLQSEIYCCWATAFKNALFDLENSLF